MNTDNYSNKPLVKKITITPQGSFQIVQVARDPEQTKRMEERVQCIEQFCNQVSRVYLDKLKDPFYPASFYKK